MFSTFEVFATHNNKRAAKGIIFDDGAIAVRLMAGDEYATKAVLGFPSLDKFMPLVALFGSQFETRINGVVVNPLNVDVILAAGTKLDSEPKSWPQTYAA